MKTVLLFLFASAALCCGAFTEFYCQTTGSNLNAGSDTNDAAKLTFPSGNFDADATGSTHVFTAAGADLSAIVVNTDWASVYNDGATVAVYSGRITAVDDGADTITISSTAKSGTAPTDGTGNRTIKVGGAWQGPNGATGFPFAFVQSTMTNATSKPPRVNFKNNASYDITAAMTTANAGPIFWQGYALTPGDLDGNNSKAEIKGVTVGASHIMLTVNSANNQFSDLIFSNAAATSGNSDGVVISTTENVFNRCVFHDIRRSGIQTTVIVAYIECEAYACNKSNSSAQCGIGLNLSGSVAIRCISHDNTAGSNAHGWQIDGGVVNYRGISESNTGNGSFSTGDVTQTQYACEYYNNTLSGMLLTNNGDMVMTLQNCNFLKNGRYGIENGSTFAYNGTRYNCGFGTGTQANVLSDVEDMQGIDSSGNISYVPDVTPWRDPGSGDFRITLPAAQGHGRGGFTQTAAGYSGSVSYPNTGAAQH